MDIIKKFYHYIEANNIDKLRGLISDSPFGFRLYDEVSLFTKQDYLKHVNKLSYQNMQIHHIQEIDGSYHVEFTLNNQKYLSKITLKDDLIDKVYETLKTGKRRLKLQISYDGAEYYGYQRQQNAPSVQEAIETTFEKALKEPIKVHSSGRTDKGVHALNGVIHFDTNSRIPTKNLHKLLNSYLPDSIYIKDIEEVNETFHSRYDVKEKTYLYKINTGLYNPISRQYTWTVENLDIKRLTDVLKEVLGKHNFTSFTKSTNQNTIRTIYRIDIDKTNDIINIKMTGNGFLRYMVRNIIGAAVMITLNQIDKSMTDIIEAEDVNVLKDKAPAEGLYLYNVKY